MAASATSSMASALRLRAATRLRTVIGFGMAFPQKGRLCGAAYCTALWQPGGGRSGQRSRPARRQFALVHSPLARVECADRQGEETGMKVTGIETLSCDAGWRNYHFVKLNTDAGIVGWSEFAEGFGSPGVGAVIARLAP